MIWLKLAVTLTIYHLVVKIESSAVLDLYNAEHFKKRVFKWLRINTLNFLGMDLNDNLRQQLIDKVKGKSAYIVCQLRFRDDFTPDSDDILVGDYTAEGDETIMALALLYAMQRNITFMFAVLKAAQTMTDPAAQALLQNVLK